MTLESETQTSASRIQILDSYGRLLKEWNLNEVPAQQAFPLDLSDIPSGLLFLQIDSQEARRIVKQ
ncbi:MAG: T9SS type A sorting domain-containing protein [Lewinellaceae bacterium]|nr:T9SS type A sorting domain-containing protein [Lewinellaceae bacterium]